MSDGVLQWPELTRELASHPLAVVRTWIQRVESGDLDAALSLYKPDAVVHTATGKVSGHAHLQAMLEASGLMETRTAPDLRSEGDDVVAVWPRSADAAPIREIRNRVEQGTIVEQWIASAAAAPTAESGAVSPEVVVQGEVDPALVELAKQRLAAMIDQIAEPVLFARVTLSIAGDPARTRPALAKATVDVNGDMVRAHVAASELRDAVDRLQDRLRDKLEHRAQHRRAEFHRHDAAEPGEWHHGDVTPHRPDFFDRPAEQRALVRHKVRVLDELTPDEVAFDMDQLDHDFELFRELASGEDAVLERVPGQGYRLTRLHAVDVDPGPTAIALRVATNPPPRVSVNDAIALLDETHEPFVFFEEPTTGHGDVVYRRYDGHYGLITTS